MTVSAPKPISSHRATRIKTRSFGFDGAAGGRRLNGAGEIPLPLPAQIAANKPLGRRARYLASNNGHAAAGVEAWVSALVGSGFKAQSQHPNRETRRALNAAFTRWCRCCDADGLTNLDGLLSMIARRMVVDGEIFIVFIRSSDFGGSSEGAAARPTTESFSPAPEGIDRVKGSKVAHYSGMDEKWRITGRKTLSVPVCCGESARRPTSIFPPRPSTSW
ncbi:Phage portal protein, lambda family [Rhodoblastus acidophilus]|uniref:Phage portal protein, lambda family n=1 Tax=Rhodoblastus acidophilus TaxID=1074 RepID=A0A212RC20_RHOAC|nr:phage portal protein [Rhodoblastus acidophilus]PPQ39428.1 phage portal protein [Rhodoblastus acidophilus]RAI19450.1 phage portal protein [Rhodoblastus acidophilus]SNB69731.1 Phage portal protein, lambda family [Rhodoblastus acidophilus]